VVTIAQVKISPTHFSIWPQSDIVKYTDIKHGINFAEHLYYYIIIIHYITFESITVY